MSKTIMAILCLTGVPVLHRIVLQRFCKVCRKTVSVANMGFSQLLAHADGKKHISNMKALQGQALFTVVRPSADGKSVVASSDPGPDNSTQQNNTPAVAISYIMFDSLEI
jgi:hypothetical protein